MNTPPPTTRQQLKLVAQNLYRHLGTGEYYGIKKIDGKKKTKCLETKDRPIANRKLADWLRELDQIDPNTNSAATLAMALVAFTRTRAGKSTSTKKAEERMIAEFRKTFPLDMGQPCHKIRHSDLAKWLADIAPGKKGRTYNRWRLFLRQLCESMEIEGTVEKSPFLDTKHKTKKGDHVVRNIPTEEQWQAILREIQHPSWEPNPKTRGGQRPLLNHDSTEFVAWMGSAGLGQAELAALRWEDIDEANNVIRYVRQKTGKPFTTRIYPWLKPLLTQMKARRTGKLCGPVFAIRDAKKALTAACRRLNFPHFSQRNLRAMRIKRLWEAGMDIKIIAETQGHSDGGKLIMDTYTEVFGSDAGRYRDEQLAKAAAVTPPLAFLTAV